MEKQPKYLTAVLHYSKGSQCSVAKEILELPKNAAIRVINDSVVPPIDGKEGRWKGPKPWEA